MIITLNDAILPAFTVRRIWNHRSNRYGRGCFPLWLVFEASVTNL